jgi:glutamate 5-kinase
MKGEIHINECLTTRLSSGKAVSILPVGISAIEGDFEKDDIVRVVDCDGHLIGCGRVNCSSELARIFSN